MALSLHFPLLMNKQCEVSARLFLDDEGFYIYFF